MSPPTAKTRETGRGWAWDEEGSGDESRLSDKGGMGGKKRGEKAKKGADPEVEEEEPRAMTVDDVDNTASITPDETKLKTKIVRVG